jgi:MinD superfamily P-loop ATPase
VRIVIASGKGGTGKTSVAVNLALVAPEAIRLLDCDVEGANCHLFLVARNTFSEQVAIPVPELNPDLCDGCDECACCCQFNCIAMINGKPLIFPELCHGCGGCVRICPQQALHEVPHVIGSVGCYQHEHITLIQGQLDIGKALAPPVIRAVLSHHSDDMSSIIDAPPGAACPVAAAMHQADAVLLVTEPTPFGLYDLKQAMRLVRSLDIPVGVLINRMGVGDRRVHQYCQEESVPILMEIPDSRIIAEAYSVGVPMIDVVPSLRDNFAELWRELDTLSKLRRLNDITT